VLSTLSLVVLVVQLLVVVGVVICVMILCFALDTHSLYASLKLIGSKTNLNFRFAFFFVFFKHERKTMGRKLKNFHTE